MQTLFNNRYRIIKTLGSGGFGETFLAEDTQMPSGRRCVIKQLRPIHNNSQIYQLVQDRFQREAAILEELGSSNDQIPSLYAYFQDSGQFYLVQEWVEGDTVTEKLQKQGLLNENLVTDILIDLLQVLDYVHSKRIIHRDIKPDNIIVRHRDNKPVLIDFGAVRETMGTMVNTQGNSTSSIVIGTPGYMPSEQAAGRAVYASDLYSLGLTAIYLLTGKQPQDLQVDSRTGEIIWHQYNLNISPNLRTVIDKAIQSHPRDRYSTATEMLQSLRLQFIPPIQSSSPAPTLFSPPQQAVPVNPGNFQPLVNQGNTVAFSPPAYQQPGQVNGQKGILIGSLIMGGLIGTSVIVGLSLSKQPQQTAQELSTTQNNATSNQQLVPSQPSSTPNTVASNEQQIKSPQAAEQTIRDYYSAINNKQYSTAWNFLTPQHQNNGESHPKGFDSFTEWWVQVAQVNIRQLTSEKTSSETAIVDSQSRYTMTSGRSIPSSVRYFLVWDASSQRWLIDKVQKN